MSESAAIVERTAENGGQSPVPRRERTRLRICVAARELFLRQGFINTTVEQIANTAELRRSTVYNHFHDKEEILGAIGQDYVVQIAQVMARLPSAEPTREEIDSWIAEFADFAASEPVPTLLVIHFSLKLDSLSVMEDFSEQVMQLYADRLLAFKEAVKPGNYMAWARATSALRELSWALCHHVEDGGGPQSQAMLRVAGDMFENLVNGNGPRQS
ncbi:MAG: TetR/AcrR family transcriptional regulator [Sphingomonadaceae bacterium]|nr:TetR/AcrR family transcriptional regulator [Sphingomonadaceae bacterium]